MATLSERMDAPGNPCWQCEKAEGWTKEVRALETALADAKAKLKQTDTALDYVVGVVVAYDRKYVEGGGWRNKQYWMKEATTGGGE
jgi:hypothetical protein